MGFPVKFAPIATYILFAFLCSPCGSAQTVAWRDPVNRKKSDVAPSIHCEPYPNEPILPAFHLKPQR